MPAIEHAGGGDIMRAYQWDQEQIRLLMTWWASGATAAAIADRLGGISRSAVLGKIHRLRRATGNRNQQVASKKPRDDAQVGHTGAQPVAPVVTPPRRRSRKKPDTSRSVQPTPRGKRGKSLLELSNDCCRWPHGRPGSARFFFCGAPGADLEHGMPYCARHARRAYRTGRSVIEKAPPIAAGPNQPQRSSPETSRSPFMAMIEPRRPAFFKSKAG